MKDSVLNKHTWLNFLIVNNNFPLSNLNIFYDIGFLLVYWLLSDFISFFISYSGSLNDSFFCSFLSGLFDFILGNFLERGIIWFFWFFFVRVDLFICNLFNSIWLFCWWRRTWRRTWRRFWRRRIRIAFDWLSFFFRFIFLTQFSFNNLNNEFQSIQRQIKPFNIIHLISNKRAQFT